MGEAADMTNEQINRLVAEKVCGYTSDVEDGFWPNIYEVWRDADGYKVCEHSPPDYCANAAAWGALLQFLKDEGKRPQLRGNATHWLAILTVLCPPPDDDWFEDFTAEDAAPGRALAIAALRAHGVDVQQ